MIRTLKILGWLGILVSILNTAFKTFGDDKLIAEMFKSTGRNLDGVIYMTLVCVFVLVLAKVLELLTEIKENLEHISNKLKDSKGQ